MTERNAIKPIDKSSVHRITSGQVVIDLQTAVKELVENSLDAGATNIEVRFKQYGLKSIEVIDNGCGIAEEYHDSIALKHHTSKLTSFSDLSTVRTFGFRGEALSSLCALSESISVITATDPPLGVSLEMESTGKVRNRTKVARQRGTTISLAGLFLPLPVRRKELERNAKREFGKALTLLNAYALGPCCCSGTGVRLTVTNQIDKGQKSVQLRTTGASSNRACISALWGTKALDNIVDLDLKFEVDRDKATLKRANGFGQIVHGANTVPVSVRGLVSRFSVGAGRTTTDRQFLYVNGRPCNLSKIQKAFNEVYRTFNANQAPFLLADFIIPTDACDINVSPDKRTIFLHSEGNLISALKAALEVSFAPNRATYDVASRSQHATQTTLPAVLPTASASSRRIITVPESTKDVSGDEEVGDDDEITHTNGLQHQDTSTQPDDMLSTYSLGKTKSLIPQPRDIEADRSPESSSPLPNQGLQENRSQSRPPQNLGVSDEMDVDRPDLLAFTSTTAVTTAPASVTASITQDVVPETISLDKGKAVAVTIDTTSAVWNHTLRGGLRNESDQEGEDQTTLDSPHVTDIPMRKKRKVGVPDHDRRASATKSHQTSSIDQGKGAAKPKSAHKKGAQQLRDRLVGFARTGSQVASIEHLKMREELDNGEPSDEGEDDQLEGDDDEIMDQANKQAGIQKRQPDNTKSLAPKTTEDNVRGTLIDKSSSRTIDLTTNDDGFDDLMGPPIFEDHTTSSSSHHEIIHHPEIIRNSGNTNDDVSLRFDLSRISATWRDLCDKLTTLSNADTGSSPSVPPDAGVSNIEDHDKAADALARVIDKEDFSSMDIIGQFNLGFIVARRRKVAPPSSQSHTAGGMMDDLFIVDQHAADEKYNFETLQQTTNIKSQKLFRQELPQPIELTASDELTAIENIDVLRQNGFEIEMDADAEIGQGGRLRLTAQPISKSTVFNMKDLEELVHLMRGSPTGQMVRCSKARAMFAMRACRKSVMVGMPLNKQQMASVVQHMGTMDQPWNCPHGRPTMRHLLDVANFSSHEKTKKAALRASHDWNLRDSKPITEPPHTMSFHAVKRAQTHLAWDNSITPVLRVQSGDTVTFDCLDASNGQITNDSTVAAIESLVFERLDQVNGPVYVAGAVPGDTLQVDVISVDTADWGWTALIPGFGLLTDEFPEPALKKWKLDREGGFAYFDEEKSIKIPLRPFAGEMGVAPGANGAFSTIPPYTTGGNLDTKHLVAGATLFLPIEADGALFSIGDGHAAQGDGEVCGTAIETPMKVTVRLTVRKDRPYTKAPHFKSPPTNDGIDGYYCTTGVEPDIRDAARSAVRQMIEFLCVTHKLNRVEAYMLCSVAGDLRIHEVVDLPNYVVGMMMPRSLLPESI